jgi:hypothetical protein
LAAAATLIGMNDSSATDRQDGYPLYARCLFGLLVSTVGLFLISAYFEDGFKGCFGTSVWDDFLMLVGGSYIFAVFSIPFCAVVTAMTCIVTALMKRSKIATAGAFGFILFTASLLALWISQQPCVKWE